MAKSVTTGTESFDAYIIKTYGRGVVGLASEKIDRPRRILPIALSMDIALSGGLPEGISVLLSGKPKAGKTSLCLLILKNAQAQGRKVFYLDIEAKLTAALLKTVDGLDHSNLIIVKNTAEQPPLSAEQWLDIIERIIKDHPGAVIVADSIAALSTLIELSESTGDRSDMGGVPRLLAQFYRRTLQIIDGNNCILIWISQLMTSREKMGKKWVEKGGMAVQYFASAIINVDYTKTWDVDADTQAPLGHDIHFKIVHSPLGRPSLPCSLPLRYGHGIDAERDVAVLAENFGLVSRSGAWLTIVYNSAKFCGLPALTDALRQDPVLMRDLESKIRNMVFADGSQDQPTADGKNQPDEVREDARRRRKVKVPKKGR